MSVPHIREINWKTHFPNAGVKASEAFEAVEEIRKKSGGEVTPQQIVAKAKSKTSVLHALFEWDDKTAAAQHRLTQARTMLRSFEVHYEKREVKPHRVYEIHTVGKRGDATRPTTFATVEDLMKDPQARDRLIADAIRQAMAFRRRFQSLRELQLIFEAIDKTAEELVEK